MHWSATWLLDLAQQPKHVANQLLPPRHSVYSKNKNVYIYGTCLLHTRPLTQITYKARYPMTMALPTHLPRQEQTKPKAQTKHQRPGKVRVILRTNTSGSHRNKQGATHSLIRHKLLGENISRRIIRHQRRWRS